MNRYIGVKEIHATPMNRADYNELRGWDLPADENGEDEGYMVEYLDGGKANHPDFQGYISWSPADVFERAYKPVDGMTFGFAIECRKKGYKVARNGWNGKGMYLVLVNSSSGSVDFDHEGEKVTQIDMIQHIAMKTATGEFVPWLASQTDMLCEDWRIAE